MPGRGRLSDQTDVANDRDMTTPIIRDRMADLIAKNRSLDEVKRAKTTRDYDGLFDSQKGSWDGDAFVESDLSRWSPRPCETPAPLVQARAPGRE